MSSEEVWAVVGLVAIVVFLSSPFIIFFFWNIAHAPERLAYEQQWSASRNRTIVKDVIIDGVPRVVTVFYGDCPQQLQQEMKWTNTDHREGLSEWTKMWPSCVGVDVK